MGLGGFPRAGGSVGQGCSDPYPGHGKHCVGRRPPSAGQGLWRTVPGRAHRLPISRRQWESSRTKFGVFHVHTLMCFILINGLQEGQRIC